MARIKELIEEKKEVETGPSSLISRRNLIIIGVLILAVVIWKFRGYFIVATVNGQPISRWELTDQLIRRFGQQSLDNIINERLILAAARQQGVFITGDQINTRVKEIEERLKGQTTLSEALVVQGLNESMFKRQIEIQLSIEKLFEKDATLSAKEMDDYIKQSAAAYKSATDPAKVKEEVSAILRQQKITQLFDDWFGKIREKADIKKFL